MNIEKNINEDYQELDSNVKKRFCKDFKIPINIYAEPYFSYFIELYNDFFSTKRGLRWLSEAINFAGGKEEFFNLSVSLSENIKNDIRHTQAYATLLSTDFNKEYPLKSNIKQQNIYISNNLGKELISIDLSQANFNCLNLLGLHEELKVSSYKDLVKKHTDLEYYLNSKMFRQIVLGDLNPQRQQRLQKYIIDTICLKLKKEGYELSSASSDEIIISNKSSISEVYEILDDLPENYKFFRVEKFIFDKITEEHNFFIKRTYRDKGNKLEFKNVPAYLFAQVFKKYFSLPLTNNDLLFYYEGFLSEFKEPLFKEDLVVTNKVQKKLKF